MRNKRPRGLLRLGGNLLDQDVYLAAADGLAFRIQDRHLKADPATLNPAQQGLGWAAEQLGPTHVVALSIDQG